MAAQSARRPGSQPAANHSAPTRPRRSALCISAKLVTVGAPPTTFPQGFHHSYLERPDRSGRNGRDSPTWSRSHTELVFSERRSASLGRQRRSQPVLQLARQSYHCPRLQLLPTPTPARTLNRRGSPTSGSTPCPVTAVPAARVNRGGLPRMRTATPSPATAHLPSSLQRRVHASAAAFRPHGNCDRLDD